jgi:hypothetical protein
VKRCLEALAARFDDDAVKVDRTVHNPARISKLPGTLCCKGDNTGDRPHRRAGLLHVPEPVVPVTVEHLEALAARAGKTTRKGSGKGHAETNGRAHAQANGHADPPRLDVAR